VLATNRTVPAFSVNGTGNSVSSFPIAEITMQSQLPDLIAQCNLQSRETSLLRICKPAIRLVSCKDLARPCSPAASKVGGRPLLPTKFDWPVHQGRHLDFLLQVNLSETAAADVHHLLPASGMLSFFFDLKNLPGGFDPAELSGSRVVYTPDLTDSVALDVPDSESAIPEHSLEPATIETLPLDDRASRNLFESEGFTAEECADFEDLYFGLMSGQADNRKAGHQLLGHPVFYGEDLQLQAQLVTNGLYCGDSTGYDDPRRSSLESGADDWLLLLQVEADPDVGFEWGDCGTLYFLIQREDLLNRRFDRVWAGWTCA
jgi:uncharacterized protein YwqG